MDLVTRTFARFGIQKKHIVSIAVEEGVSEQRDGIFVSSAHFKRWIEIYGTFVNRRSENCSNIGGLSLTSCKSMRNDTNTLFPRPSSSVTRKIKKISRAILIIQTRSSAGSGTSGHSNLAGIDESTLNSSFDSRDRRSTAEGRTRLAKGRKCIACLHCDCRWLTPVGI